MSYISLSISGCCYWFITFWPAMKWEGWRDRCAWRWMGADSSLTFDVDWHSPADRGTTISAHTYRTNQLMTSNGIQRSLLLSVHGKQEWTEKRVCESMGKNSQQTENRRTTIQQTTNYRQNDKIAVAAADKMRITIMCRNINQRRATRTPAVSTAVGRASHGPVHFGCSRCFFLVLVYLWTFCPMTEM